jgi:hypothetical protein
LALTITVVCQILYVTVLAPYFALLMLVARESSEDGAWDGFSLFLTHSKAADSYLRTDVSSSFFFF